MPLQEMHKFAVVIGCAESLQLHGGGYVSLWRPILLILHLLGRSEGRMPTRCANPPSKVSRRRRSSTPPAYARHEGIRARKRLTRAAWFNLERLPAQE
jgi:hypothetical protein